MVLVKAEQTNFPCSNSCVCGGSGGGGSAEKGTSGGGEMKRESYRGAAFGKNLPFLCECV